MKFGTNIMGVGFRHIAEVAGAFDDLGFESVWVPEHLVLPADAPTDYPLTINGEPPFTPDTPMYDPWVVLAHLAAATKRVRLGTNVYIMPLRHPLQTARTVVTLDRLSNGRVILGVGVGWLAAEFEAVGASFDDRGQRADGAIDVVRKLWTDDVIEVHDEHFDFGPVKFQPKPLQQPSIPIEVGAYAGAGLRRAGTRGDGWIEIGCSTVDAFRRRLAVVLEARETAGRTGVFEITVSGELANDPGNYDALAAAGATRILVDARVTLGSRLDPGRLIEWAAAFSQNHIES